ncbi:MAG TPA: PRC-barrel domain-containing protein [Roseomonas sp.]
MSQDRHPALPIAAVAVLLATLVASLPVAAQTPTAPPAPPAVREELPREASQRVIGREVTGPSGDVVGRIINVLLDEHGQPSAAVLDYGGFLGVGRRRVAVVWRSLRFSPEMVRLELTRDQMRAFPDYREGDSTVVAAPPVAPEPAASPEPAAPAEPAPSSEPASSSAPAN